MLCPTHTKSHPTGTHHTFNTAAASFAVSKLFMHSAYEVACLTKC